MTYFKKWPKLITGLIFIFALFSLIQGSRSEFLLNFIISGLLFYILINTASIEEISPTWHQKFRNILPKFILLVFTMLFITANLYEYSVKNGYLSDDESYKYYMQKNTKIGLFSGRGELIASFLAIKDSPILGHGSFAKDSNAYGYKASVLIGDDFNSESYFLENRNENYIPTHSHLWQAWVYNGVFGAIFWLFILIGILGVFFKNYIFFYPQYLAFTLCSFFGMTWNILFSPFSQKPLLATSIVFFVILMKNKDKFDRYMTIIKYD